MSPTRISQYTLGYRTRPMEGAKGALLFDVSFHSGLPREGPPPKPDHYLAR